MTDLGSTLSLPNAMFGTRSVDTLYIIAALCINTFKSRKAHP